MRRHALAITLGALLLGRPAAAQDRTARDAGAAIDPREFRYTRPITLGTGLTSITLDAAVLAHSSLNDLRIATPSGHQVPYVLEQLDTSFSLRLPAPALVAARGASSTNSTYRVRLPYAGLPASRLVIHTDAHVFTRVVRLEAPPLDDDARARSGPIVLAMTSWRNDDPEQAASALSLDVPALRGAELRLVVDEGDNAPLPLRDVSLLLPTYRLRFYQDGHTPLTLLYGRPELGAPRYDLALLAARLRGAPAQETAVGPEVNSAHVTGITPTIVFWCALGVAVLALVVLIAKLLRPNGSPPAAPAASSTTPTTSATPAIGE